MAKEKNTRVQTRVTEDFKTELYEVIDDINNNRNPNLKKFGVKDILFNFVKDYQKTQPYGLVYETNQLKTRLDEVEDELEKLTQEKNELTAQIKVNENIINNKKLDEYKDQYTLELEEAKADYLKRLSRFGDRVDKDEILKNVCKQHPNIRLEDLKEIL